MSPTARRRRAAPPPDPYPETGLAELGLARGDQVRFRRADTERWKQATVAQRERDGSIGLHDPKGASRAIPIACIEVRGTGPRGGVVWEPLADRAARTEQMALVAGPPAPPRRRPSAGTGGADPADAAPTDAAPADGPRASPAGRVGEDDGGDDGPGDLGQLALL